MKPNEQKDNSFAIYQLKDGTEYHELRFAGLSELRRAGKPLNEIIRPENYHLVYTALLPDADSSRPEQILEDLYTRFNIDRPKDFTGHSMSVSDVVVLNQSGQETAYYCDSFGFEEIPGFLSPLDYLRNAETVLEDDFDMVGDGIINNGMKSEEKPSLRVQLTELSTQKMPQTEEPVTHQHEKER